jgi:hypothetical protein
MGVGAQRYAPAAFTHGKACRTHFTGGWVGPSAGLDDTEDLASTGICSPYRLVRSESLYLLSSPGATNIIKM